MKLIVPIVPPSANKYQRMHWAKKKRLRRKCVHALFEGLIVAGIGMEARINVSRRSVRIIVNSKYERVRRLDKDNLYGGCKPLIDAMRDIGLIVNDSPRWIDLTVSECRDDGPFTVIEINDLFPAKVRASGELQEEEK